MHKVSGSSMGLSGLTQNSSRAHHLPRWQRQVPVTYNIYFTFVNVFIIFTTTSRAGSALLSALWKATGTRNQPYKLQWWGVRLSRNLTASRKFTQRTTSAHAMLSPAAPWQGARETTVNSKWASDRLLIASRSLNCHLLAVKQGPEERTILGCTWWLHLSHVMLLSYSRKVFLHPSCTPQHT